MIASRPFALPTTIPASRSFMLAYSEANAEVDEETRLVGIRLDRRKRKRLLRKARERGAREFFAEHGKH